MEYQSTQYRAGHMTQDMETITIQKGEEKKRANDRSYLQSTKMKTMEGLRNPGIPLQFE